jgi:hypothetical protein
LKSMKVEKAGSQSENEARRQFESRVEGVLYLGGFSVALPRILRFCSIQLLCCFRMQGVTWGWDGI